MNSIILCSPSPGTVESEMITFIFAQAGSVLSLYAIQYLKTGSQDIHEGRARCDFIGIPGFLDFWFFDTAALRLQHLKQFGFIFPFSFASWAERNRRERCWFILARGATPSIAIINNFLGRTILTTRSVYLKIAIIISSSSLGGGLSSGCEQGCTIPFMSRYRLSNSSLLGFGPLVSTGISIPSISRGCSSMTGETILGYFWLSQRNNAAERRS